MTNKPDTTTPFKYLTGDLHSHCESPDLIDEHFALAIDNLDFVALTNHSHKPFFPHQSEMVETARRSLDIPVFYGFEWNAPKGRHANVIFPPSPDEADIAIDFINQFDPQATNKNVNIAHAIQWLADLPTDQQPIVFFNHPYPGHWSTDVINEYRNADPTDGNIIVGIETIHGHQGWEAYDPLTFDGCKANGLPDTQYNQHRRFALLAGSDFHVQKQSARYDYPVGLFNRTAVGLPPKDRSPQSILNAIRRGNTWALMGDWLKPITCNINNATPGETYYSNNTPAQLSICFQATEPIAAVDVIGTLQPDTTPHVLNSFTRQDPGTVNLSMTIPPKAHGFIRLRIIAESNHRPPSPNGPAPKMCFTSAIIINRNHNA